MSLVGAGFGNRPAWAIAVLATVVIAVVASSLPPPLAAPLSGTSSAIDRAALPVGTSAGYSQHGAGVALPVPDHGWKSGGVSGHPFAERPTGRLAAPHPDGLSGHPEFLRPATLAVTLHVDPRDVTTGQNAYLHAVVAGGSPPLYFTWYNLPQASFLPTGCSPRNAPIVFCAPAIPGEYNISVVVSDGLGLQATANGTLYVFAPGLSVSVSGTPIPSAPGQRVELNVTVSGGVGPYRFHWTGLPAGCLGSTYVVDCSPRFAGAFPVNVTVQDYSGESATSNLTIVVVSPKVLAPLAPSVGAAGPGIYVAGVVAGILVVAAVWWASKYRVPGPWRARTLNAGLISGSPADLNS